MPEVMFMEICCALPQELQTMIHEMALRNAWKYEFGQALNDLDFAEELCYNCKSMQIRYCTIDVCDNEEDICERCYNCMM